MPEIAIMIEGQNGLTWPRWQRIVRLVEEAGFVGLGHGRLDRCGHRPG